MDLDCHNHCPISCSSSSSSFTDEEVATKHKPSTSEEGPKGLVCKGGKCEVKPTTATTSSSESSSESMSTSSESGMSSSSSDDEETYDFVRQHEQASVYQKNAEHLAQGNGYHCFYCQGGSVASMIREVKTNRTFCDSGKCQATYNAMKPGQHFTLQQKK
jgi:hypothetical protein